MGGWHDRNRFAGYIQAGAEAGLVNRGEAGLDEIGRFVGDVQINALRAAAFHFGVDGPGHDIAWGEFLLRIVPLHEAAPAFVDEDGTFSSHGFRDEKGLDGGVVETCWMELDELHVRDHRTGAPGHSDAIPRGDVGIRCVEIDFPATACGQHSDIAAKGLDLACGLVEHIDSHATILHRVTEFAGGYEIHRHMVFHDFDARMRGDLGYECALDFVPRGVPEMENAALGVAALASEIQFMVAVAIFPLVKVDAEFHEFSNALGAFGDDLAHGVLVAEARPRIESVTDVEFKRILVTHHTSHSALRPGGVRICECTLRDECNTALLRCFERERQASDAAAKDDEIKFSHEIGGRGMLSMRRALPRKTATASRPAVFLFDSERSVEASTASM